MNSLNDREGANIYRMASSINVGVDIESVDDERL